MKKYCTMCEADSSSTLEARHGNKAVRACVWQEVYKWCEKCAAAKEDCKVMRVCEKQAFVKKNNMNKIEMNMPKEQLKETEPHKLCEPAKHQGICTPESHKLCEPEQHAEVWCKYDSKLKELYSQTEKRKRNKKGIKNLPAVPISHPTHHNTTHQNGPNSGSKGEECSEMERGRSKVGRSFLHHIIQ
eukprot:10698279-Ditylum_brightwellii.AAC.1